MRLKHIIYLIVILSFLSASPALADAIEKNTDYINNSETQKLQKKELLNNLQNNIKIKENQLNKYNKLVGGAAPVEKNIEAKKNNNFIKKYIFNKKLSIMKIIKIISSLVLIGALIFWILILINWSLKKMAKSTPIGLANTTASSKLNEDEYISNSVSSFVKHKIRKKI